jgi:hypothetical protein
MHICGRCHCGNIAFTLEWTPEPGTIPARACTCSFCTRHGGVWTSCPSGSLVVTVGEPAQATTYAFGTETAEFHVCTRCGIVPVATSRIDGRLFAVVNVNTFENVDPALLRKTRSDIEAETEANRLARRARNWIGDVAFVEGVRAQGEAPAAGA